MSYTTVSFQVNDEHLQRFINGMAGHFGYDPETAELNKAQYVKKKLRQQMVIWVKRYERDAAIDALEINDIEVID